MCTIISTRIFTATASRIDIVRRINLSYLANTIFYTLIQTDLVCNRFWLGPMYCTLAF